MGLGKVQSWVESVRVTSISISEGWEGRTVNGVFPLLEWLGGSSRRGVFLTVRQGTETACIKLIMASGSEADAYLSQWQVARAMCHPDLARVMESGRCTIDGREMVFVVTERAESVLSAVVPRKALDQDKVRKFLDPVLNALLDLHEKGLVHGHLKPSNILRAGDQWKLSGDGLVIAGERPKVIREPGPYDAPETAEGKFTPASDVWSLGMIIAEAFTQHVPASDSQAREDPVVEETLERPFSDIVRACLRMRPAERCSVVQMKALLSHVKSAPAERVAVAEPVATAATASVGDEATDARVEEPSRAEAEQVAAKAEPDPKDTESVAATPEMAQDDAAPATGMDKSATVVDAARETAERETSAAEGEPGATKAEPVDAEAAPSDIEAETVPEVAKAAATEVTSSVAMGTAAPDAEAVATNTEPVAEPAETQTVPAVADASPDLAEEVPPGAKEEPPANAETQPVAATGKEEAPAAVEAQPVAATAELVAAKPAEATVETSEVSVESSDAKAEPVKADVSPTGKEEAPAAVEAQPVAATAELAAARPAEATVETSEVSVESSDAKAEPVKADVSPTGTEEAPAAKGAEKGEEAEAAAVAHEEVQAPVERSQEPRPSRWEMETEDEAVHDAIGVAPRSRLFGGDDEEEQEKRTRSWPVVLGIVFLLAVAAGYVTRGAWIGRVMPIATKVSQAIRKPATQVPAPAAPTEPQAQSQSVPQATGAAAAPQPVSTGEDQSAATPGPAGQEGQTQAANSAATGHAESQAQSSAASSVKPTSEPADTQAERKPKEEAQTGRGENKEGAVLKQVMPNVSSKATEGMRQPVEVELRVSVDNEGNVTNAEYRLQGPGNYFARVAKQSVMRWEFQPPVKDGQARSSIWTVRFHFGREETEVSATEVQ